ncbi:hypothetical protein HAX54_029182, partial [Datura stramonium]|nr:hypothetical protein [Datura stramonium]
MGFGFQVRGWYWVEIRVSSGSHLRVWSQVEIGNHFFVWLDLGPKLGLEFRSGQGFRLG